MPNSTIQTEKLTSKEIEKRIKILDQKILHIEQEIEEETTYLNSLKETIKTEHKNTNKKQTFKGKINKDLFVAYYLEAQCNATEAYRRLHPEANYESAKVEACRLLTNPNIKAKIEKAVRKALGESENVLKHQLLDLFKKRAFYDPAKYIDKKGRPIFGCLEDIPFEDRCAIDGIKEHSFGEGGALKILNVTLANRMQAAAQLAKYIKLFGEDDGAFTLKMTDETANRLSNIFKGGKSA